MNATVQRLESDAHKAMQAYFKYGNDTDLVNASMWYDQAHGILIGKPLSKAKYRSILRTRRRLLTYMSKREPVKKQAVGRRYLVPIRGDKGYRELRVWEVKIINDVEWYVFDISTTSDFMLAGFKAGECMEVK